LTEGKGDKFIPTFYPSQDIVQIETCQTRSKCGFGGLMPQNPGKIGIRPIKTKKTVEITHFPIDFVTAQAAW